MNQFKIYVGDPSGDGHKQYETIIFNVNKTQEEINAAYKKLCKDTKLSLTQIGKCKVLLEEFEDNEITADDMATLKGAGVNFDQCDMDLEDNGSVRFWGGDSVFHLLMAMCKVNLPDLEYEIVNPDELYLEGSGGSIGYGVYSM